MCSVGVHRKDQHPVLLEAPPPLKTLSWWSKVSLVWQKSQDIVVDVDITIVHAVCDQPLQCMQHN